MNCLWIPRINIGWFIFGHSISHSLPIAAASLGGGLSPGASARLGSCIHHGLRELRGVLADVAERRPRWDGRAVRTGLGDPSFQSPQQRMGHNMFSSFQLFSALFACFQLFSPLFASFNLVSPRFASFHLVSPRFTSFNLVSPLFTIFTYKRTWGSGVRNPNRLMIAAFRQLRCWA